MSTTFNPANVPASEGKPIPVTARGTTLVVVDMQNGFIRDNGFMVKIGLGVERCQQTIEPVRKLIDAFHSVGAPVVYTRMWLRPDFKDAGLINDLIPTMQAAGGMIAGTWDAQIVDELAPGPDDWVVNKNRYSPFFGTNLEQILRILHTENVVACGVTTNVCVESFVRDAFFRDFRVMLPRESTAAITAEMEEATFLSIDYCFGFVSTVDEVCEALAESYRAAVSAQGR
jgi:ureidoacrylate peracid hydrolase